MTDKGYVNMKRAILYPVLLLFCAIACDQPILQQGVYSEDLFLKDQYTLNPLGDTISFTVNAYGSWSLSKPSWLIANRLSGRGMQTITLIAEANTTGSPQTGEIVINSSEIKRIAVSQANPYAYLSNDKEFLYRWDGAPEEDGGGSSVRVNSNLYWRFEPVAGASPEELFKLSSYEGLGDADVTVSALGANLDTLDWTYYYRLASYVDAGHTRQVYNIPGVEEDSIQLVQRHFVFLLNGVSSPSIVFDRSNFEEQNLRVTVQDDQKWSLKSNPGRDWLEARQEGSSTLRVVPTSANVTKFDRTCRLALTASPSGAERYVDVMQERYNFYFARNGFETDQLEFDNMGGTLDLSFISSGSWRVESCPAGVSFNPSSGGEGETLVQVSISDQNLNLTPLTRNLLVRSTDPGLAGVVLRDTLQLRQPEFEFRISSGLDTLPSAEGTSRTCTLVSSGPWQVDSKPDWVNISPESSDSPGTFKVTVWASSENTSETNHRTGTIRFVCPLNPGTLRREIPVVQMRTKFDLSRDNFTAIKAYDNPNPVCTTVLESSQDWSITELPAWISVSSRSGKASSEPVTLYFTVSTNTSKSSRSGRALIQNQAGKTRQITFTQDGLNFDVQLVDYSNQPATGSTVHSEISCYPTVPWSLQNVPNWITPSQRSGTGSGTVFFTLAGNSGTIETNGSESRSASVGIRNDVTYEVENVEFSQSGYRWTVTNASSYSFGAFKGEKSSEFTITADGSWYIETPDWIQASKSRGSKGTERITLTTTQDNAPATNIRTSYVTVVCDDFGTLNKSFSVKQEKYNLAASPTALSFSRKAGSQSFTVTSDGTWSAKCDASWVTLSLVSGTAGSTTVTVTCQKNSKNAREAKIVISDTKHTSIPSVTVTVNQAK